MRLGPADFAAPEPQSRVGLGKSGPGGGVRRIPFRQRVGRCGLAGEFAEAIGSVGHDHRRREPAVIGRESVAPIKGRPFEPQASIVGSKQTKLPLAHDAPSASLLPFFDCAMQYSSARRFHFLADCVLFCQFRENARFALVGQTASRKGVEVALGRQARERPDGGASDQGRRRGELFERQRSQTGIGAVADGDQHIAQKARMAEALDRTAREQRAKLRVAQPDEFAKRGLARSARAESFASRVAWANLFHGQTARQSSQP